MLGIDAVELLVLLILAVVMFGPEKLPQYSRKAARIFVYLRDIANNAKETLGNELGPEYADLELRDLNPKAFLAKHLREEVALLDQAKKELSEAQKLLKETTKDVEEATHETLADTHDRDLEKAGGGAETLASVTTSPFDSEAT